MFTNRTLIAALGLTLLAGAAGAGAGDYERSEYYERRGPMPFEVLDLNSDGVVTAEEHAQVRTERHRYRSEHGYPMRNAASAPKFDQIDSDGSGAVERDELSAWQAQRMQQRGMGRGGRW